MTTGAPLPWRAERPLDAARVERVLDAQFPDLAPASARYLDEGWDSEVYEVVGGGGSDGGAWIFRFPKRKDVEKGQAAERALLPRLERLLPLPIPSLSRFGEPCADFPFAFLGYRKLPGVPGTEVDPSAIDLDACGEQMAEFLDVLHSLPPAEALRAGLQADALMRFASWREHFRKRFAEIEATLGPSLAARVTAVLEGGEPPPLTGPRRFVHYDIGDVHVLLEPDGSRITGVIDWGDAGVGDPAVDFAGLWQWLGRPFVDRVLARYSLDVDDGLLERARLGAVFASLSCLWYGVRASRPEFLTSGLRGLENSLSAGAGRPAPP